MATRYQLVETYDASHGWTASLAQPNTAIVGGSDDPWYRKGIRIGSYVPASTLSQLPGLSKIESAIINPHKLRQLASGMTDAQGRDISGFYVVSDIGAVLLFKYAKATYKRAKRIDCKIAPSTTVIESGRDNVIGCGYLRL